MLESLFVHVLSMTLTGSYVILLVILVRLLLKKFPKKYSYALWSVVLFRLLFPFSLISAFSFVKIQPIPIPQDIATVNNPQITSGITFIDDTINPILPSPTITESVNSLQIWIKAGVLIWISGILILLLYNIISLIKLKHGLTGAVRSNGNIYFADHIQMPFVIGIITPKIFLPSTLPEKEHSYIILHEQIHIKHLDYLVKLLAYIALCIHWFNPLVWLAFVLLNRDMEMSCDESVLKHTGEQIKKNYSSSLVGLSAGIDNLSRTPLAFGECDIKERVKNVMKYKTPTKLMNAIGLILVLAVCAGCVSNNVGGRDDTIQNITFPAYQEGKNEYNSEIYEIEPFNVSLKLPEGWEIRLPDEEDRIKPLLNFFTYADIYSDEQYIGYIGYNIFTPYDDDIPAEDYYKTVYPGLRLGSMYFWGDYTPIITTDNTETAIATVNYKDEKEIEKHPGAMAHVPYIEVPGILSYDKNMMVYIGIQFAQNVCTDEELKSIAESLILSRN